MPFLKPGFKLLIALLLCLGTALCLAAADPTVTKYDAVQCQGTSMPYPHRSVADIAYPDSLKPVFINHVGRHGARFLSSSRYTDALLRSLGRADSLHTITADGRRLLTLCNRIVSVTAGRWGALDSLGMAEQRAIASRTFMAFPSLFDGSRISAVSSYVPRCIMSMYEFTHQLSRLNNKIEISTSSGRQFNPELRPWSDDADYKDFISSEAWSKVYGDFFALRVPEAPAFRMLGKNYSFDGDQARDFSMSLYKMLAGCSAMSLPVDATEFLSIDELNALWSVENLHHYLTYSASTLSSAPVEMASQLLKDLIATTDMAAAGDSDFTVMLRFGHAETLMPLFALMHLPGCYYITNYFDTVGLHWRDFYVAPMAANLKIILFRTDSGRLYVRTDLNETPVPLIPGRSDIYVPWTSARQYLIRCLPLHLQP